MEVPNNLNTEQKESIRNKYVLLFESIGTALFVYISVAASCNNYYISLGYLGCLFLFARLCGGHFNPGVTLALALSGSISPKQVIYTQMQFFVYLVPQLSGAFAGAGVAFLFLDMKHAPYTEEHPLDLLASSLIGELMGATIFYVFVLIQFVKDTRITQNKIYGYTFIAAIYYASREYTITSSSSLLNPAAGLALTLFDCIATGWSQLINLWIYTVAPIGASFIATIFYSQLYSEVTRFNK